MEKQLRQVREFHEVFSCHIERAPTVEIPREVGDVRVRLMREELEEYEQALAAGDLVEVADALSDLLYVVLGSYLSHGLQDVAESLFAEVHRSNMSKLGKAGQPILRDDGKILKPDHFSPPDLKVIIESLKGAG